DHSRRRRLLSPERNDSRRNAAPHDGMAASGTLVRAAVWGSRSTNDVHSGAPIHREAGWHSGSRTTRAQGLIRRPSDEYALGCSSSGLFRWRSALDLLYYALPSGDGWRICRGSRTVARGHRKVARTAGTISWLHRDAQPHSGVLLRYRFTFASPRLQREYCGWLSSRPTHLRLYRRRWNLFAVQAPRLHARA